MTSNPFIYHITPLTDWQNEVPAGTYRAASLDTEGFIHCSTAEQIIGTANLIFRAQTGLLLLCLDESRITAPVVYEDCYETGMQFPHIYGTLNLDAVVYVLPFPPRPDGTFELPPATFLEGARPYPILDYDPNPQALLQPENLVERMDVPAGCVLCFFNEAINALNEAGQLRFVRNLGSEIGHNPVYELTVDDGRKVLLVHPGVGAPLAGGFLEELIALGCTTFIACGGAGSLHADLTLGHVVVPTSAVRDEGTSYHYLPPSREVSADPAGVKAIQTILDQHTIPYVSGKTWTTDAPYRETPALVQHRRAENCLTVEMEAAAFFAIAQFRQVSFAQLLYAGDDLSSDTWDSRNWHKATSLREKLLWLAAEACLLACEN